MRFTLCYDYREYLLLDLCFSMIIVNIRKYLHLWMDPYSVNPLFAQLLVHLPRQIFILANFTKKNIVRIANAVQCDS